MTTIAFLGLGAMGRRMAVRLLHAQHDVVAWNRTGVADEVVQAGARVATSPRAAAAEAEVVISMVADDAASSAVWDDPDHGALAGLRPGALAIESSTVTPERIEALAGRVATAGGEFLAAPAIGSRPQAESGALIFLTGGAPEAVERARPVLSAMGSAIHRVGPPPSAAVLKLVVNALLGVQIALLGELLEVTRRNGLDAAEAFGILSSLPVLSPSAKAAGASMLAGRFEPLFPVALAEKDLRYALAAGRAVGVDMSGLEAIAELYARAVAAGFGGEHLTAVAKLYAR